MPAEPYEARVFHVLCPRGTGTSFWALARRYGGLWPVESLVADLAERLELVTLTGYRRLRLIAKISRYVGIVALALILPSAALWVVTGAADDRLIAFAQPLPVVGLAGVVIAISLERLAKPKRTTAGQRLAGEAHALGEYLRSGTVAGGEPVAADARFARFLPYSIALRSHRELLARFGRAWGGRVPSAEALTGLEGFAGDETRALATTIESFVTSMGGMIDSMRFPRTTGRQWK